MLGGAGSYGKVTEIRIYQASYRRTTSTKLGTPERTPAYAIIRMDRKEFAQVRAMIMISVDSFVGGGSSI